jgi:hypothetical protein
MGEEHENNVEDNSGYEKTGVQLAWMSLDDLISVWLHAGSGLVPAISSMVYWLAHKILWSLSFWWWCPISSHHCFCCPQIYH